MSKTTCFNMTKAGYAVQVISDYTTSYDEYLLKHYYNLCFSSAVEAEERKRADNPKRRQREASKQIQNTGVSPKSQIALQMLREAMKTERKQISRAQREAEEQHRFELKQQKKKKRGH